MSLKYVNKKVGMKYSREDIDKTGAQYNIILSGRNAGKSYSIAAGTRPHELIDGYIPLALEKKSCVLGYVRRLEKETKGYMVEDDFSDKFDVIKKLSKGNYDEYTATQQNSICMKPTTYELSIGNDYKLIIEKMKGWLIK